MFMRKSYESEYHKLEKTHFWFNARRDMILKLLGDPGRDYKILDIGCSIGSLVGFLAGRGYTGLYGIDISGDAIAACRKGGLKNVFVMDATKLKFPDKKFDVVIASDIVEHIEDHDSAIREFGRVLKPGGKLLVFVPAFGFLWTNGDDASNHHRRYTKKTLSRLLEKNGMRVGRISYWNFSLFVPFLGFKLLKSAGMKKDEYPIHGLNPVVNNVALKVLKLENVLIRNGINFPFGVSVFAVAEKS